MAVFHPPVLSVTFWRSLQTLNVSRCLVALILVAYMGLIGGKGFEEETYGFMTVVSVLYLLTSVGFVTLKAFYPQRFMSQLASQISIDIVVISFLYISSGGSKSGLAILYLFPLAGIAILAQLMWALFFVSVVTLFLLAESGYHLLRQDNGTPMSQAGLYGAAYFAVVIVVSRLARNLISQEELAHRRGQELAVQQAINRLVIADMGDGILVVDQDERLFEINPAAERTLGLSLGQRARPMLQDIAVLHPILESMRNRGGFRSTMPWGLEQDTNFVAIRSMDMPAAQGELPRIDVVTHLKLRFVDLDRRDILVGNNDRVAYTIIFMQDVSDIENKAQQLKLASMGRLTASIAHEVRNPLSSISYAASLLSEDISNVAQTGRLLKIVDDNVVRLNQLIEDILKLSRKAQANTSPFPLVDEVLEIVRDFVETKELPDDLIQVDVSVSFAVIFDLSHLREIVVNLLSNALRYASGQPGSIRIYAVDNATQRHELHIEDDGPGIPHSVRSHLFEPFYTTSSKGTGLGLYMARELCLNNHALLDYDYYAEEEGEQEGASKGSFVIKFSMTGLSS